MPRDIVPFDAGGDLITTKRADLLTADLAVAKTLVSEELSSSTRSGYGRAAGMAGFDVESLGGHSLRTGFVTSAAATGASVAVLANVTRHTSADVLLGYVRTANLVADYPVAILR
jgi:hypothetical protein